MCDECIAIEHKDTLTGRKVTHRTHKDTGLLHCKVEPAVFSKMEMKYFLNGKLHRLNGPAHIIKYVTGSCWYIDGQLIYNEEGYRITTQEELESSTEYREWKLKAFK